ncbi:MAG: transcription factor RcaD [Coleofasciculaceae cyanobacterium]
MEIKELKFLLKLLGCNNYRSAVSAPSLRSITGRDKLCRDLSDRGFVDFSREIATVKILPAGRALLKLDAEQLPLIPNELKVLESIGKASVKIQPSKITVKPVKSVERDAILQRFHERGLIEVEMKIKKQKAEVWITDVGIEYLHDEYNPKGTGTISLDLLNNYIGFLRKSMQFKEEVYENPVEILPTEAELSSFSDQDILQTIQKLDQELGTENYLPIFHLRQKLQPPLERENLDQALYRLQRSDQIELSSLQEMSAYTPEQIDAGISQSVGGSLFFITVN